MFVGTALAGFRVVRGGCGGRAASLAARRPRRTQSIYEPTVDRSLASP